MSPGSSSSPSSSCGPGCAGIRGVRLYGPGVSGRDCARPGDYVDPAKTPPQRGGFAAALEACRRCAAESYGGLVSSPTVVECASMACYRRFGGLGRKGVFRNGAILLSPEGLTPVIVAHEWPHAELAATRVPPLSALQTLRGGSA